MNVYNNSQNKEEKLQETERASEKKKGKINKYFKHLSQHKIFC